MAGMPEMRGRGMRELYFNRRVGLMLPLGFTSGLPLLLTGSTLSAWARDAGVSLTNIGLLGSISTVYALKFLWAPLLDRYRVPLLDRRRGWLLLFQLGLLLAISAMGMFSPAGSPWTLAGVAFLVALFSASQDIVADAFRIDVLEDSQRGSGAGLFVGGYRLGMIVASGLALALADCGMSWSGVYAVMGLCMGVGIVATLAAPAVPAHIAPPVTIGQAVVTPLRQLLLRHGAWAMILFVVAFKLPDVLGNYFSMPFLQDLGVTKTQIGWIKNTYGLAVTIVGALAGAALVAKAGLRRCLLIFGILQAVSNAGYLWMAMNRGGYVQLVSVISIENFCGGLVTAGFSIYLMAQCDRRYSAFQFALLTSAMALANFTLGPAGWAAEQTGWAVFFLLTIVAAVPGMLLLPFVPEEAEGEPEPRGCEVVEVKGDGQAMQHVARMLHGENSGSGH